MIIPIFLLTRLLDIFSTYLVLNKYGYSSQVEGNIVSRYIIINYGFNMFILTNILISLIACILLKGKYNIVLKVFIIVSGLVASFNFMVWSLI